MSLFTRLLHFTDSIFPHRCLSCREPISKKSSFCPACATEYNKELLAECGMCGRVLSECSCSIPSLSKHGVKRMIKLFRYRPAETHEHSLNLLLYRLKHEYVTDIHTFFAKHLRVAMEKSLEGMPPALITFVPRTVRERRKYGFDQSKEIAKALAKETGMPFAVLLRRRRKTVPQKKMRSTEARIKNALESYLPATKNKLCEETVFLVDDTVTSGASIATCARILRRMGAKEIIAVAPFISYRHKNLHFEHVKNSREERFYIRK